MLSISTQWKIGLYFMDGFAVESKGITKNHVKSPKLAQPISYSNYNRKCRIFVTVRKRWICTIDSKIKMKQEYKTPMAFGEELSFDAAWWNCPKSLDNGMMLWTV